MTHRFTSGLDPASAGDESASEDGEAPSTVDGTVEREAEASSRWGIEVDGDAWALAAARDSDAERGTEEATEEEAEEEAWQ